MDIRKIKKLIELVEESGIAELEITEGEESVRIHRGPTGVQAPMNYSFAAPAAPQMAPAPAAAATTASAKRAAAELSLRANVVFKRPVGPVDKMIATRGRRRWCDGSSRDMLLRSSNSVSDVSGGR